MKRNRQDEWEDEEDYRTRRQRPRVEERGYRMSSQGYPVDEYGVRLDRSIYHATDSSSASPKEDSEDFESDNRERPARGRQKKKRSPAKAVVKMVAVLAALAVVLVIGGVFYLWTMLGRVDYEEMSLELDDSGVSAVFDPAAYNGDSLEELPLMGDTDDVTNILLIGIDSETFEGRADTNMILSINTRAKTIKMASLMRDTWVTLPGVDEDGDGWDDEDRLNAAYAYGGASAHLQMIEENFRLHIDKYIAVDFEAFPKVIDAMGGVDIDCRGEEAERVPAAGSSIRYGGAGYIPAGSTDGTYHFDGFQALQYARIRYLDADGDFSRTARQRKLVSVLIDEAREMNIFELHNVLYDALPEVRTNMSRMAFMGFSLNALRYSKYTVDSSYRVPQDDLWQSANMYGMSVLVITDKVASVKDLHEYLYG